MQRALAIVLIALATSVIAPGGEIGDAALLFMGLSTPIRAEGLRLLAEGAARATRSLETFPVTFNTLVSMDRDEKVARERVPRSSSSSRDQQSLETLLGCWETEASMTS